MNNERTVVARRFKDGTFVEVLPDGSTRPFPPSKTDWEAFDRLTEEEINAAALSDPDNPPLTPEREMHLKPVHPVMVTRLKMRLTPEEFADRFHLPLDLLRDWERGVAKPDQAMNAYLTVIARNPDAVGEALAKTPSLVWRGI